ncbi:MAG: general secretion pathway protein GspB [Pseudomonadota bacterium]
MSYILDALRKSERERQRGNVPNLASEHRLDLVEQPKPPLWPWVLTGVILACTGIISYVFWPKSDKVVTPIVKAQPSTPSSEPVAAANTSEASAVVAMTSPGNVLPPLSNPRPVYPELTKKPSQPPKAQRPETSSPVSPVQKAIVAPTTQADIDIPDEIVKPSADSPLAIIPSINTLDDSVIDQIPAFEFSTHIYSSDSQKSFVIINGKMLSEKQMVTENMRLEKIYQGHIVLKINDDVFKVESLKSWTP